MFNAGDRVTVTYNFPGQAELMYKGTIKEVFNDRMVVLWDELNGQPNPPKEMIEWNYFIFDGGDDSTPIKKIE